MQLAAKQAQAASLLSQVEASEEAAKADQLAGDDDSAHTLELKLAAAEEDVSRLCIVGAYSNLSWSCLQDSMLGCDLQCLKGLQAEGAQQQRTATEATSPCLLVPACVCLSSGKHADCCCCTSLLRSSFRQQQHAVLAEQVAGYSCLSPSVLFLPGSAC